jgi:hypothetical protein
MTEIMNNETGLTEYWLGDKQFGCACCLEWYNEGKDNCKNCGFDMNMWNEVEEVEEVVVKPALIPKPDYCLPVGRPNYWLSRQNCWWNVLYHIHHSPNKKNHKQRAGLIQYKGKVIYGNDADFNLMEDIDTRRFHYGCGHTWTELKNGEGIIDWVINDILKTPSSTKVIWSMAELTELGFEHIPYKNEKAILNKVKKTFYCSCKDIKSGKKNYSDECGIEWARNFWKDVL